MIANLMMYQRPELADAHERLWGLIRRALKGRGIDAPRLLSQEAEEFFVWKHPHLVLSMTCGMPYRLWLHNQVELVGTLDYGLDDCPAGYYRSAIVSRADDVRDDIVAFRDAMFAYNQTFSQSGYGAAYFHVKQHGFFWQNKLHTQQHLESARAVVDGRADIASLDGVTWRNVVKYEEFADQLRVLEWSVPTPGLPLITALGNNGDAIFEAVAEAIDGLELDDRAALGLRGIVRISKEDYLAVPTPPQ
jgi:ABC-type phosphate/phosphonate transport system substrate-binding protein